jgi:5-methyltetrahydropteroyltriglutamate--homocysteine methyltransferase
MLTHNLGYPRIGGHRELKTACEGYWSSRIGLEELLAAGRTIRTQNWQLQRAAGIDLIPCNDFSYYDHVLDLSLMLGAIPQRYRPLAERCGESSLKVRFGTRQQNRCHLP